MVGGNLGLLDELKGTPYFPDIRDSVLFLEHCAEHEVWTFNRNLQALCLIRTLLRSGRWCSGVLSRKIK